MPAPSRRAIVVAGVGLLALPGCSRNGGSQQRELVQVHGSFSEAELSAIADAAQTAAGSVVRRWGRTGALAGKGRVIVRAAADEDEFRALGGDASRSVAATTTDDAVVLMSPQLCAAKSEAQRFVLTHEITHTVLGVRSVGARWVAEGAAELTAWKASGLSFSRYAPSLADQVRQGRDVGGPPPDADFDSVASTSESLNSAYQRACAYSDLLRSLRGDEHYRRFVHEAMAGRTDATSFYARRPGDLSQQLRSHLRSLVGVSDQRR